MSLARIRVIGAALLACLVAAPCLAQVAVSVRTQSGLVSGTPGRDASITAFRGIPYAEPPVGPLRWTAPRPPRPWNGVREADTFSAGCAQIFAIDFPKSEDCLYLNVWTPAKTGGERLPVMVWIHGGGLRVGATSEPIYNGEELAAKGVVVVTVNYRLGVLGFLAHPELSRESPHGASGNYGLLDQLAALQWVRDNIAAFGGDPSKVTIFGQSGGAYAVTTQVASPLAKGLFRGAIVQSLRMGYLDTPMDSLREAEQDGLEIARAAGAGSLAELRALPTEKILAAGADMMPLAVVDGWYLPESAPAILARGGQNRAAVMIGATSDEGQRGLRSPMYASSYSPTAAGFVARARDVYGPHAETFLSLYPAGSDAMAQLSQQHLFADLVGAGTQRVAAHLTRGGTRTFLYTYQYLDTGEYNSQGPMPQVRIGPEHGAELPYVFGLLDRWKAEPPASDLAMQAAMMGYWTNFAKTLDPNGPGLPAWAPFEPGSDAIMVLDRTIGVRKAPRADQLRFLVAHPARP
jgi:para-nitrobenzyl esterase